VTPGSSPDTTNRHLGVTVVGADHLNMATDVEAGTDGKRMELAAGDGGAVRSCRLLAVVATGARANAAVPVTTNL
jgi:hypothetical protein